MVKKPVTTGYSYAALQHPSPPRRSIMAAKSRNRSSSLPLFSRKKKDKGHKMHIAAALIPTQAFAFTASVRCEAPGQPGYTDVSLNKLNETALSNSLLRRSLDKSLDDRDREELQKLSSTVTPGDSYIAPGRRTWGTLDSRVGGPDGSILVTRSVPSVPGTSRNDSVLSDSNYSPNLTENVPRSESVRSRSPEQFAAEDTIVKLPRKTIKLSQPPPNNTANRTGNSSRSARAANRQSSLEDSDINDAENPRATQSNTFGLLSDTNNSNSTNRFRNLDTVASSFRQTRRLEKIGLPGDLARSSASADRLLALQYESDETFGEITDASDSETAAEVVVVPKVTREMQSSAPRSLFRLPSAAPQEDKGKEEDVGLLATRAARPRRNDAALRQEVKVLQDTVQRLSVELSRNQAVAAIQNGEIDRFLQSNKVQAALGSDDALPMWLVDQKYLSPLFASYDRMLKEKDRLLKESLLQVEEFDRQLRNLLQNGGALFAAKLVSQHSVDDQVPDNWSEIVDQCKQVIDENAWLKKTVERQTREINELEKCHVLEVSRLNEQIRSFEANTAATNEKLAASQHHSRALEKALVESSNQTTLRDLPKSQRSTDLKTSDALLARVGELEAALDESMSNYAEAYDRARSFAESVVRLSSENSQLQAENGKQQRKLAKLKSRIKATQETLLRMQLKDHEKNNLLKDLMSITDDIAKQRKELADNLKQVSNAQNQVQDHELRDKDLKLKWLEAMLQNSVNRAEQEQLERRRIEEDLHSLWEATVKRDRNRFSLNLSRSGSGSLLRNGSPAHD